MRRRTSPVFWIILVVAVALVVVAIIFWPWLRQWLPHHALVKAWVSYLTDDLDIVRWGPVVTLFLVGVIELVWALILGRRSGASDRQWKRLERLHAREVTVLNDEIARLREDQRALHEELELREELIREEKVRLWARFDALHRGTDLPLTNLAIETSSKLSPELKGEWRQIISQLERIETISSVTIRGRQSALELPRRAEELSRLGGACYHLGQYERALTHYGRVVELASDEPQGLVNHAVVNFALGRQKLALQDLDRALKREENAWAYYYRGLIRERMGDNRPAIEDYARALRLDPDFVQAYHRRGLLLAEAGDYERSFQDQSAVLELDDNHARAYMARGVARAALGDSQRALGDLDRACVLAPQDYKTFYQRGLVRHELEMYEEALADLSLVVELDPNFGPAYMARGDTLLLVGKPRQALTDYLQAVKLQPKDALAHYACGEARAAIREHRQAIEDYDRALALDPGLALAFNGRGVSNEQLGEFERAIEDLNRALVLDPNLAVAYYNRGLAYGSKGEYDTASRDLNRAAELDPSLGGKLGANGKVKG